VWISPDAYGHIQATGQDQRGRKQYRYHAQWAQERDGAKYSSLVAFAESLADLRHQIDADLRRHGLPLERVVAAVVWLLDNTMIRVGNAAYARDNKSFGLTTLRDRHVDINGSSLRFAFSRASPARNGTELVDRRIAKIVRGVQDLPGQKLFQYLDGNGNRRPVRSDDVNRLHPGRRRRRFQFQAFQNLGRHHPCCLIVCADGAARKPAQLKRVMNGVIDKVAEQLAIRAPSVANATSIRKSSKPGPKDGCLAK
jgi:DNA topoisomerase-1